MVRLPMRQPRAAEHYVWWVFFSHLCYWNNPDVALAFYEEWLQVLAQQAAAKPATGAKPAAGGKR